MKSREIVLFEQRIKSVLDWSNIDPGTKSVLQHLMAEVAALAEKMQSPK